MPKLSELTIPALFDRYVVKHRASRRDIYHAFKRWYHRQTLMERSLGNLPEGASSEVRIPKVKGCAIFPPGRFPEVDEIVRRADAIVSELGLNERRTWDEREKKQLWDELLQPNDLTLESPFFRFATRPDIVGAVSEYLGEIPILAYVDVWYSPPLDSTDWESSQLHHCDWDASSQIKIFVLASDVTPSCGPLTVLDADSSDKVRTHLKYRFGAGKGRVRDETIHGLVGQDKEQAVLGPKGTVGFVDASRCFHYGSRTREGATPRVIGLFQYVSPTAFNIPLNYAEKMRYQHLAHDGLPNWKKLLLGAG